MPVPSVPSGRRYSCTVCSAPASSRLCGVHRSAVSADRLLRRIQAQAVSVFVPSTSSSPAATDGCGRPMERSSCRKHSPGWRPPAIPTLVVVRNDRPNDRPHATTRRSAPPEQPPGTSQTVRHRALMPLPATALSRERMPVGHVPSAIARRDSPLEVDCGWSCEGVQSGGQGASRSAA